jgi:hypothetical protein
VVANAGLMIVRQFENEKIQTQKKWFMKIFVDEKKFQRLVHMKNHKYFYIFIQSIILTYKNKFLFTIQKY